MRMPRLQVALQQTLRGLPNHRLQAACMDQATWIARLAEQRIVIRLWALSRAEHAGWCRRRRGGGALRVTASTGASSELAAHRSPQRAPALARSEPGSGPPTVVSTLQAQSTKQQGRASGSAH